MNVREPIEVLREPPGVLTMRKVGTIPEIQAATFITKDATQGALGVILHPQRAFLPLLGSQQAILGTQGTMLETQVDILGS